LSYLGLLWESPTKFQPPLEIRTETLSRGDHAV
jgi:hypothetical protein